MKPIKLNIKNILLASAILFFIVNLLVIFDLNAFYIRAVLAFLFLIIVPGLLIMLIMKIREVGFWEYLVYTIGLSVSFIMFAGLAVNWILPWLNITDKPLSLWPILICFDIFLLIMGFFAWKRNRDLKVEVKPLELNWLNRIFFIIPMLFPVMAILGAFILNNFGPNTLTMIMLGLIAVYVLFLVILKDRLNENIYPWALWMIGLSLLLMVSLRSWHISGWDILQERYVASITSEKEFWSISTFKNAYNACISISLLPKILLGITNNSLDILYKIHFQFIYSFGAIILYIISRRFVSSTSSFLSVFFTISLTNFFLEMPSLIRQEVSLIFFLIILLIITDNLITVEVRRKIFVISAFSMIISHYSTSYIALSLIAFAFICERLVTLKFNNFKKSQVLSLTIFVIIILFAFVWYSQITETSSGALSVVTLSIKSFHEISNNDLKDKGISINDQLNIFKRTKTIPNILENYTLESKAIYENRTANSLYNSSQDQKYKLISSKPYVIKPLFRNSFTNLFLLFGDLLKILIKVFIIVGSLLFILLTLRSGKKLFYNLLVIGSLSLIVLMIVLPILSINYPIGRLYLQAIYIAPFSIFFLVSLVSKKINPKFVLILVGIIIILFFTYSTGFINQLVTYSEPSFNLHNNGRTYDQIYTFGSDVVGFNWFSKNYLSSYTFYADNYNSRKIFGFEGKYTKQTDILPLTISKKSYVILGYSNIIGNVIHKSFKSTLISYKTPKLFLDNNKNKVYSTSNFEVFK